MEQCNATIESDLIHLRDYDFNELPEFQKLKRLSDKALENFKRLIKTKDLKVQLKNHDVN